MLILRLYFSYSYVKLIGNKRKEKRDVRNQRKNGIHDNNYFPRSRLFHVLPNVYCPDLAIYVLLLKSSPELAECKSQEK